LKYSIQSGVIGNRRHSILTTFMFRLSIITALILATTFSRGGPTTSAGELRRDPTLLAKPVFSKVSAASLFEIDLSWRDNSSNEDGFQIERSRDKVHFQQLAQVLPGTTVYRDRNLFPGTRYFYRIRAYNSSGNSGYSTGSGRTPTPPRPLTVVEWGYTNGVPPTNQDLVSVSAGNYHSLALRKNGTVVGWGDNFYGEATPPTNLTGVVAISAGEGFSLALKDDGALVSWGSDLNYVPTPQLTNVVAISVGLRHGLALKGDGTVVAWGWGYDGETNVPPGLAGVVAIAAGSDRSVALKSDGTVVAWGNPYTGIAPPTNLDSVVAIADAGFSLAVKSDGTIVGWGNDTCGMISTVTNHTKVADVAAGWLHSVALNKDGTLSDWGCDSSNVTPPDLGGGAVAISAAGYHFAALSTSPLPPSRPSAVVLAANEIRLSWRDNSVGEKGFRIERAVADYPNQPVWTEIGRVNRNKISFTDKTLIAGTTYWYRVRAFSSFGTSPYSTLTAVVTAPLVAPQNLMASVSSNQVNLTWSDFPGFEPYGYVPFTGIDGFKVERAPDNNGSPGAWAEIASLTSAVLSSNATFQNDFGFSDATVQPDTTYWYRVRAFNVLGLSDYSSPFSVGVLPPPVPNNFYAYVFADQVQLSWSVDQSLAQGVKIERAPYINGSPGAWAEIAVTNTQAQSYQDVGLPANTTYWYRMRAFNWAGDSAYTVPVVVSILPPQPPNSLSASVGAPGSVNLWWYQSSHDEDGFTVERAPDAGGNPGIWSEIASFAFANAYAAGFADTNVVANATYWYRIRAFNALGFSDYSGVVSISLVPPPAPSSLTATPIANRVDLRWSATDWTGPVGSFQGRGFKIERALDVEGISGDWTQIATFPPGYNPTTFYSDTGLAAGATYWYRVVAYNWIGESSPSALVVITVLPPAAPWMAAESISTNANQVDITLIDFANDEDGFYIERAVDTGRGLGTWTQIGTVSEEPVGNASFIDTNATAFATNWYRVRAYNVVGISDYGPTSSIALVPPGTPFLMGYAFSDQARLNWNHINYPAEGTIGYKLERAPDAGGNPGTWTQITQINGGATTTYSDSRLAANTTYWYRMRAFNWIGDSDYSDPWSIIITPPSAPPAPYAAIGETNNSVDLTIIDYLADQDGFTIERAPNVGGNPGLWTQIGSINATNEYSGTFTDTNVTANTTNWYRVRAFSAAGISAPSMGTQLTVVPPNAAVISGYAFADQANLNWYDPSPFADGVTGYKLQRAPDVNGSPSAWVQLTNTSSTEYSDSGLAANSTNWYRVSSHNWVGDSPFSDSIGITMSPPEIPDHVIASLGTTNQVYLTVYDSTEDEDGFKIERVATDDTNGTWVEIGTVLAPRTAFGSFLDTNAMPNETYWYRARAFNGNGISDYTGVAIISIAAPDAPNNLFAYPFKDTIHILWSAPDNEAISGFHIDRAPDAGGSPGDWITIATNKSFLTDYLDHNLSAQATYWYRLRAFNWVGESLSSSPARATITPPVTPDNLTCKPGTTNQGILSWTDPASDQDGFNIERAPDIGGVPGAWVPIGSVNISNYYFATFTDTNVAANSTNWYRVQAFNAVGASPFSGSNSLVVVPPTTPPTLTAGVVALHRINLFWYTDGGFIEGYIVERAFDTNGAPGDWIQIADVLDSGNNNSYSDTAVVINRKYWYRVRTHNWAGSSAYSNEVLVDDAPPAAPVLTAVNDQPNQITLNWTKTADNLTGFKIERAPDNGGAPGAWIQIAEPLIYQNLTTFLTTYADTQIPTGQTYWYRVRASNTVGDSPYSNEASASSRNGQFVRIMQWDVNGALGRLENNSNYRAQEAADIVSYNHPDVLLLNGIDAQGLIPAQSVAALINWVTNNLTYLGKVPASTFYVGASTQSGGGFRNAIISRFPILNETDYFDGFRGLHAFQMQIPDTNVLQIFQAHLSTNTCGEKEAEAEMDTNIIAAFAATNSLPYIFAGDWNEDEDAPLCTLSDTYHPISTIRGGAALGEFKPTNLSGNDNTWSTQLDSPSERFDYILSATNRIAPVSGYVFSTMDWGNHGIYSYFNYGASYDVSDHYPVVATFYFNAPSPGAMPGNSATAGNNQNPVVDLSAWRLFTNNEPASVSHSLLSLAPQILALTPTNNDVLVEWMTTGGGTDTLQAADGLDGTYSNISPPLLIGGNGSTTTNYLESGALTNGPVRFYRIHSSR
jgi:alpha-tubulin suppressor-like RCC1 family protein/predicted phage tail protein